MHQPDSNFNSAHWCADVWGKELIYRRHSERRQPIERNLTYMWWPCLWIQTMISVCVHAQTPMWVSTFAGSDFQLEILSAFLWVRERVCLFLCVCENGVTRGERTVVDNKNKSQCTTRCPHFDQRTQQIPRLKNYHLFIWSHKRFPHPYVHSHTLQHKYTRTCLVSRCTRCCSSCFVLFSCSVLCIMRRTKWCALFSGYMPILSL